MNIVGLYTLITREVLRMLRISIQSLIAPWIAAGLYIFIFGFIIGSRIDLIAGVRYIDFILPGIVMMNIITSAFTHSSSSVYLQRFTRSIEEILVAPLSYLEMIIGFSVGGILRGILVGLGVYVLALFFTTATITHFWLFIFYAVSIAAFFSFLGMLVGILSNHFEHLALLNTFVILPLIFLGGVFNSITMMPPVFQVFMRFNPFFYFVDGFRFAMIGIHESNLFIGAMVIVFLTLGCGFLVWHLFRIGYRIKV